jgi:hypothetical protein
MQKLFEHEREKSNAPRYYLWSHPNSPYAIELRLDLIDRMMADLRAAQSMRLETGGLLLGTFVRAANPTLRIEDYESIGRRNEDELAYNLTPEQRTRFAAVRHKFISQQVRVLGFFRSQIRGGPLALSPEDRDLLNSEFRRAIHIALLVRLSARPTAGFLVPSANGEIQSEPAWNQFPFETEELSRLSAVQQPAPAWSGTPAKVELAKSQQVQPAAEEIPPTPRITADVKRDVSPVPTAFTVPAQRAAIKSPHRKLVAAVCTLALVLTLSFTIWGSFTADLLSSTNRLDLTATGFDLVIQLKWNHDMAQLRKADSALLTIQDGAEKQEMTLSAAELKGGSVAYRRHSPTVIFTMTLNLPDSMRLVQSATWAEHPSLQSQP